MCRVFSRDDACLQGVRAQAAVTITGNTGGNFENVATTGTVLTSVIDDADTSTESLRMSAPCSVLGGSTITYTATVDNAVTGSDLVLTLSNGQHITISVFKTAATVELFTLSLHDALPILRAQAAVTITGNTGGNFENVATTGTVLTSV